ncbi:rhomboid protein 2 [Suhomyces tanzawaensis NRRL Y-17324]|uniref:Rhomboid-type serine protease 2 n=1 Tax=Suhomyces tanzawaensis NRRL Y-17324 TaxID=984487 RepID=A0A1E4SMY0_9ASCO|nr:rhomboid protein 2 [Suhomyces tanzawaensis NRRL Y-17324]ODV80742.1 rhomboid protein 2 [Suhomyces tanzawaensis NRRL Y-17324]
MASSFPLDLSSVNHYPALTVGLPIFTFILLLANVGDWLSAVFSLYPGAPFKLDLNRLSFYILFHRSFLHWFLNCLALATPMAIFERTHGTVYTGVTLNLLAAVAGLQYCVVGLLFYPDTHVVGLSGVVFSFLSYVAVKEHQHRPVYTYTFQSRTVSIPTLWTPLIFVTITAVLLPGSSLFGHLAGVSTGYLLGLGYLKVLYPPSKVILWIERKLAVPISKLDGLVVYYRELEAIESRGVTYTSLLVEDLEASASTPAPFRGDGQVLGA